MRLAAAIGMTLSLATWVGSGTLVSPGGSRNQGLALDAAIDPDTIFLLRVDERTGQLADEAGVFVATARGSTRGIDPEVGPYLRFGEALDNGISVQDGGRIVFDRGFTLELWVLLEKPVEAKAPGLLAFKPGSFSFDLKDNKLNNGGLVFPTQTVATTSVIQHREYPVDHENFFGATPIPVGRWVHLAITYDERMKAIRTWIDGGIDRTRYLAREDGAPLLSSPSAPVELLRGMRDIRVASVRLSRGAGRIGPVPSMEAYVQQLPFRDEIAVCLDHIDHAVATPIEVAMVLESPGGPTSLAARVSLDSHSRREILLDAPSWKGALHTLTISAYSRHRLVFSRSVRIANPRPGGTQRILDDRSVAVSGKRLFPRVIYNVFPEDYASVAKMGFNVVIPRDPGLAFMSLGGGPNSVAHVKTCVDEAQRQGIYLLVTGNSVFGNLSAVQAFRNHPAILGWMAFDEPWGRLEKVQESYNVVKLLDPDKPIYSAQNNATRFAETAEGADILAVISYPLPRVSLRDVFDRTAAAVRSVAGLKPVWTILGQYRPAGATGEELRCMAYLAIAAGANGLGFYAWDDRPKKAAGWYVREHPEDEEVLRSVVSELRELETILLAPNSERQLHFHPPNPALHGAIKETEGRTYLFLASDSRKEEAATLKVDGFSGRGRPLSGRLGGSPIVFDRGRASLRLEPLFAEVFELR